MSRRLLVQSSCKRYETKTYNWRGFRIVSNLSPVREKEFDLEDVVRCYTDC